MSKASNWMEYVQNPKGYVLKKFLFEVLKDRYPQHEPLLERIGHYIVTEEDIKKFGKMITDVYEIGYLKAVNDHKDALAKMGLKATISQERKNPG